MFQRIYQIDYSFFSSLRSEYEEAQNTKVMGFSIYFPKHVEFWQFGAKSSSYVNLAIEVLENSKLKKKRENWYIEFKDHTFTYL